MKKKTGIILLIVIALTTVAVFSANEMQKQLAFSKDVESLKNLTLLEEKTQKLIESDMYDAHIAQIADYYKSINNSCSFSEELYEKLFSYVFYTVVLTPDEETLNVVDSYILSGLDADLVIDTARFLSKTTEGLSVMDEIISAFQNSGDEISIEDSYNKATGYIHGVLGVDEIYSYMEKGAEASDIRLANEMSRMGVYTITELLDKYLADNSWEDLYKEIYKEDVKGNGTKILNAHSLSRGINEKTSLILSLDDKEETEKVFNSYTIRYNEISKEKISKLGIEKEAGKEVTEE